jgi:hypothetical protein
MPHMAPPNYRQQRAIDAIDRATVELSIVIKTHAPDTDAVRQAQRMLMTLTASVKVVIMNDND